MQETVARGPATRKPASGSRSATGDYREVAGGGQTESGRAAPGPGGEAPSPEGSRARRGGPPRDPDAVPQLFGLPARSLIEQPSALVSAMDTVLPAATASTASLSQAFVTAFSSWALSSTVPW